MPGNRLNSEKEPASGKQSESVHFVVPLIKLIALRGYMKARGVRLVFGGRFDKRKPAKVVCRLLCLRCSSKESPFIML
jgi:hypothetical protein